jgi:hypothetical protein
MPASTKSQPAPLEGSSKGRALDPERLPQRNRSASQSVPDSTSNASCARRNSPVSLSHHARKCAICKHPDRQAIDDDFINWRSHHAIAVEYQLPARSSLYRHAEATGLLARRRRNLRGVAERILEQVADAPPSAASVLRALRIFTQITEDGQWVDPPKRSIVTHVHITETAGTKRSLAEGLSEKVEEHSAGTPSGVHSGAFAGAFCAEGGAATLAAPSPAPSASRSSLRDDQVSTESEAHVAEPPTRRASRGVFYANNGFGPPCPDPLDDFLIATPNKTGEHLSD